MKSPAPRAIALLLLLLVAEVGALPCVCAAPPETAAASSHCSGNRDGFRAREAGCDCACMRAADTATPEARIDPARVAHVSAPLLQAPLASVRTPPSPVRPSGRSCPPSPPLVLRI